mmetsp:Transcript_20473/g.46155  ORF Transcript_20473/g.46155 Transcript_20473/m.46155 type:complete len:204 (+) Transcript_20473:3242-3853(+)
MTREISRVTIMYSFMNFSLSSQHASLTPGGCVGEVSSGNWDSSKSPALCGFAFPTLSLLGAIPCLARHFIKASSVPLDFCIMEWTSSSDLSFGAGAGVAGVSSVARSTGFTTTSSLRGFQGPVVLSASDFVTSMVCEISSRPCFRTVSVSLSCSLFVAHLVISVVFHLLSSPNSVHLSVTSVVISFHFISVVFTVDAKNSTSS